MHAAHSYSFCDAALMDGRALQAIFKDRLRQEMEERRLSTAEVSRQAKKKNYTISQSTVSRLSTGKQAPTLEVLQGIAEVLGVPPWALITESGQIEQRVIRPVQSSQNIARFPSGYPKIGAPQDKAKIRPRKSLRR